MKMCVTERGLGREKLQEEWNLWGGVEDVDEGWMIKMIYVYIVYSWWRIGLESINNEKLAWRNCMWKKYDVWEEEDGCCKIKMA